MNGRGPGPRVLHLGKYFHPFRGGIENFLRDLAREQAATAEVLVLAHHHQRGASTSREEMDNVAVVRVRTFGSLAHTPLAPGFGAVLARELAGFRPDVVHAHLPNVSAFWLLLHPPGCPVVVHWHADVAPSALDRRLAALYPFYRPLEQALLRRARRIVVTSRPYLETSQPLARHRDRCRVVPLGLDPARFVGRDQEAAQAPPDAGPMLLAVGRFAYYKGFEHLVRAAALLPGVRVVIAGGGPLWPAMRRLVDGLGLAGQVELPGPVDDATLHRLLAGCQVFCLPSVERTEAFGMVLLEAMAFGRPLVTTAIPGSGMGYVNQDGITGIAVRPGDPQALAAAVRRLLDDDGLRCGMGRAARERFAAEFHIRPAARRISAVYAEARGEA